MSERGSFVTEYIYCPDCLEAVRRALLRPTKGVDRKAFDSSEVPAWTGGFHPIICGKLGGSYQGNELVDFETHEVPLLEQTICHPIRIAVLGEVGERIFTIEPKRKGEQK